jgi:hypothetical protein
MKTSIYFIAALLILFSSCKKDHVFNYPKDGLMSYFTFDNNLSDKQAYTNDGTKTGLPTYVSGKSGKAIYFNGVDQGLTFIPKSAVAGTAISIACWIKPEEPNINSKPPLYMAGNNGENLLMTAGNTNMGFVIANPLVANINTNISSTGWTHFVVTYGNSFLKIYVNGILKQTLNHAGTFSCLTQGMNLGFHNSTYWKGSIDELFIYNRVLSEAEINTLYKM